MSLVDKTALGKVLGAIKTELDTKVRLWEAQTYPHIYGDLLVSDESTGGYKFAEGIKAGDLVSFFGPCEATSGATMIAMTVAPVVNTLNVIGGAGIVLSGVLTTPQGTAPLMGTLVIMLDGNGAVTARFQSETDSASVVTLPPKTNVGGITGPGVSVSATADIGHGSAVSVADMPVTYTDPDDERLVYDFKVNSGTTSVFTATVTTVSTPAKVFRRIWLDGVGTVSGLRGRADERTEDIRCKLRIRVDTEVQDGKEAVAGYTLEWASALEERLYPVEIRREDIVKAYYALHDDAASETGPRFTGVVVVKQPNIFAMCSAGDGAAHKKLNVFYDTIRLRNLLYWGEGHPESDYPSWVLASRDNRYLSRLRCGFEVKAEEVDANDAGCILDYLQKQWTPKGDGSDAPGDVEMFADFNSEQFAIVSEDWLTNDTVMSYVIPSWYGGTGGSNGSFAIPTNQLLTREQIDAIFPETVCRIQPVDLENALGDDAKWGAPIEWADSGE